jgi:hypothetical protein
LRFDRMSGLDAEQLDELEELISDLLEEPWDRGKGHPRELTLREALIVASGYARNNIIEEIWAEIFDVNQSTISSPPGTGMTATRASWSSSIPATT